MWIVSTQGSAHQLGQRTSVLHTGRAAAHAQLDQGQDGARPCPVRFLAALGQSKGSYIQVNLTANTNLSTVDEFRRLAIKGQDNTIVRLEEIADVVLGAEDYDAEVHFSGQAAVFMGIWPLPNANSVDVIRRVQTEMAAIQADLPAGMQSRAYSWLRRLDAGTVRQLASIAPAAAPQNA